MYGFLLLVILIFLIFNAIEVNRLVVTCRNICITPDLKGFKIAHLSDVHLYGRVRWYQKMVEAVKGQNPNIICITGDLVDRRIYRPDKAVESIRKLCEIAPVYFVPGNHEYGSGHWTELKEQLKMTKAVILEDQCEKYHWDDKSVYICGLRDRLFYESDDEMAQSAQALGAKVDGERAILLTHRPERYRLYKDKNFDLILAGHIHGGLIGLPSGKGLVENINGPLPEFSAEGVRGKTPPMIISRGIGNTSLVPVRLWNPPEIVVIEC